MELVIHQIQSWFKWILCPRTPRVPQKYVGNQIQRSEKESIEENKVMIFMGDVDPRRIFKFIFFSPPQTSTPRIPPLPGRSLLRLVGGNVGGSMHGREWKSLLPLCNLPSLTCQLPSYPDHGALRHPVFSTAAAWSAQPLASILSPNFAIRW